MKRIVLLLLFFCVSIYAKTPPVSVVSQVVLLDDSQKSVLYEFAVLQKNGSDANIYWEKHKNLFPALNDSLRDEMANEVFVNSRVLYTPIKKTAIELWVKAQSITNWMLYLAAFIAVCGVMGLLRNYWSLIIKILMKQFEPLFKVLFSEVLLTYELLLIGIVCVFIGGNVEDIVLRTVLIHIGFCLIWSQSTALFTKEYLVRKYIYEIQSNFWEKNKWKVVKTICFPAIIVTVAILYVLYKVPEDKIYYYEVVVVSLVAIYALPIWRSIERYIYPVLIPYKDVRVERSIYSLATCTVLALFIDAIFLYQSGIILSYFVTALTSLLIVSFLILSLKVNYKHNYKNYIYLQFVAVFFFLLVLLYSFYNQSLEMIWVSLIGVCVFVIIKYWEIVMFYFSWNRRNRKWAWGFLGMAVLLWGLAKGILYILHQYLYVI
ncbi:hypothetical protein OIU80_03890 [Flavobacterium sp. LS1R47]|uniref:DUF4271 domain-containing protein n=1 Tax=Flavobacterium frigoritolerans TaxID=2987686 RepID=A0A9X2ZHD5_9FLAO|nr:hypothetical protein [Flavobacterium frigoritolerans]MCV9931411.1 hypothetical protein [Flavobacterium frigoritolerans]